MKYFKISKPTKKGEAMLETLANTIKVYNELKTEKVALKLELEKLEVKKYLEWKQENPKSRTAMDKVIGELKSNDKEWQDLEEKLENISLEISKYGLVIDFVKKLVGNPEYSKEDIKNFIKEV